MMDMQSGLAVNLSTIKMEPITAFNESVLEADKDKRRVIARNRMRKLREQRKRQGLKKGGQFRALTFTTDQCEKYLNELRRKEHHDITNKKSTNSTKLELNHQTADEKVTDWTLVASPTTAESEKYINERISHLYMKLTSGVDGGLTEGEHMELDILMAQLQSLKNEQLQRDKSKLNGFHSELKPCKQCSRISKKGRAWDLLKQKRLAKINWYKLYKASVIRCRQIIFHWLKRPSSQLNSDEIYKKILKAKKPLKLKDQIKYMNRRRCRRWEHYAGRLRQQNVVCRSLCTCLNQTHLRDRATSHTNMESADSLANITQIKQEDVFIHEIKPDPNYNPEADEGEMSGIMTTNQGFSYEVENHGQNDDQNHTKQRQKRKRDADPDWEPDEDSDHGDYDNQSARKEAEDIINSGKLFNIHLIHGYKKKMEMLAKLNKANRLLPENPGTIIEKNKTLATLLTQERAPKPKKKIPRPMNAFMLFSQQHRRKLLKTHANNNQAVSVTLGGIWSSMTALEKDEYYKLAKEEEKKHKEKYPEYWEDAPPKPRIYSYSRSQSAYTPRKQKKTMVSMEKSDVTMTPALPSGGASAVAGVLPGSTIQTVVLPPGMMLKPVPGGMVLVPVSEAPNQVMPQVVQSPQAVTENVAGMIQAKPMQSATLPAGIINVQTVTSTTPSRAAQQQLPSGIVSVKPLADKSQSKTTNTNSPHHIKFNIQPFTSGLPQGITKVESSSVQRNTPSSVHVEMPVIGMPEIKKEIEIPSRSNSDEIDRPLTPTRFTKLVMENINKETVTDAAPRTMNDLYEEVKRTINNENVQMEDFYLLAKGNSESSLQLHHLHDDTKERKREKDRERMREWRERKRLQKQQEGYIESEDDRRRKEQDRNRAKRWRDKKKGEKRQTKSYTSPTLAHEEMLASYSSSSMVDYSGAEMMNYCGNGLITDTGELLVTQFIVQFCCHQRSWQYIGWEMIYRFDVLVHGKFTITLGWNGQTFKAK